MENKDNKRVITVLVKNQSGVLARVASLFGRRGYNIDSLTVSATDNPDVSRMTVVVCGDDEVLNQIVLQTQKLQETLMAYPLSKDKALHRELLLVKLEASEQKITPIREICAVYGAQIVDLSIGTLVIELTGITSKIDAFLEVISQYPILEMCRTGATAMERGYGQH